MDGKYLTPEELCARWRDIVSVRTLERWRLNKRGPRSTRIGGKALYLDKHVIEYEEEQTTKHVN